MADRKELELGFHWPERDSSFRGNDYDDVTKTKVFAFPLRLLPWGGGGGGGGLGGRLG